MEINAFINFNGNCRQAAEYYAKVFQADPPRIASYGDNPPDPQFPMTEEVKKLVMYTEVILEGGKLMLSDVPPGMPLQQGNNISIAINAGDKKKLKGWFNALKEEGAVEMELEKTFWSELYGSVTDKFGITWQFNCSTE